MDRVKRRIDMDLADYFREEINSMEQSGASEAEISRRLDEMNKIQQLVVKATL
jgi:hypothetical protein